MWNHKIMVIYGHIHIELYKCVNGQNRWFWKKVKKVKSVWHIYMKISGQLSFGVLHMIPNYFIVKFNFWLENDTFVTFWYFGIFWGQRLIIFKITFFLVQVTTIINAGNKKGPLLITFSAWNWYFCNRPQNL